MCGLRTLTVVGMRSLQTDTHFDGCRNAVSKQTRTMAVVATRASGQLLECACTVISLGEWFHTFLTTVYLTYSG